MAREQRRLAAIVSADVAGYSRLMGRDESGTLATLKAHRRELIDPTIAEYGGRIVKTTGDGLLLEFASVVEAVRSAVDAQRGMVVRNAEVPTDEQIEFRIGINVGDIIIDGEDIYGDGVNVAARLQALAEPGGICVSKAVRDQVLDKLSFTFDDLGAQQMKNIARPIEVYRLAFADNSAAEPPASRRRSIAQEPPSLAVLPFVNRSSSEEDEYFSDGLADELLNVLAKIRGLRVAARTSSFRFKGKNDDIAVIGRKLNVTTVLEGSVRKAGNRMRISVQLVNVADGYHLWSETYDRAFDDIFAVQDDIAQSVVQELRTKLFGGAADAKTGQEVTAQVAAAAKGRATDPEAHRLYLQARYLAQRNYRDDVAKAIGYLKEALELDPGFALAWAEVGGCYALEAVSGWAPLADGVARARAAVARALALEPDLAEAHTALGWIRANADWDWAGAEASYGRALELAPGNARVVSAAGLRALHRGRLEDAMRLYRQALEQDPLRAVAHARLANALELAGRFPEAEVAHRKALELAPKRVNGHQMLSLNLLAQGRSEEALTEASREPEEWARYLALAIIHYDVGHRNESDAALQALITKYQDVAAYQIAEVYGARNELELAFQWLERAYDQRDPGLAGMKCDQLLRSLHGDPQWDAFLRKMGLAD
jgi:TolB-like protein/Flp pilus assembly protein TadD